MYHAANPSGIEADKILQGLKDDLINSNYMAWRAGGSPPGNVKLYLAVI